MYWLQFDRPFRYRPYFLMIPIRLLLVLGILSQPFCGHCFAELRSVFERTEMVDIHLEPVNDSSTKQTVCTKSPYVKPTKTDIKPQTVYSVAVFAESFVLSDDFVASVARQTRPLFLRLSVLRN